MVSFENIQNYSIEFPDEWTFLWSAEEARQISNAHKDQIYFLNDEATNFVNRYLETSKIIGRLEDPISQNYFNNIEKYQITENTADLKKWLFNTNLPFDKFVFTDCTSGGYSIMLTWKMVIKYCEGLFFSEDLYIFDNTLNWALFYYHENEITFGLKKIYNKEIEYDKALIVNQIIQKLNK